jgi:hypothetical protein
MSRIISLPVLITVIVICASALSVIDLGLIVLLAKSESRDALRFLTLREFPNRS